MGLCLVLLEGLSGPLCFPFASSGLLRRQPGPLHWLPMRSSLASLHQRSGRTDAESEGLRDEPLACIAMPARLPARPSPPNLLCL